MGKKLNFVKKSFWYFNLIQIQWGSWWLYNWMGFSFKIIFQSRIWPHFWLQVELCFRLHGSRTKCWLNIPLEAIAVQIRARWSCWKRRLRSKSKLSSRLSRGIFLQTFSRGHGCSCLHKFALFTLSTITFKNGFVKIGLFKSSHKIISTPNIFRELVV